MPQFDSGAAEPIGRFSEGLLLRLLQPAGFGEEHHDETVCAARLRVDCMHRPRSTPFWYPLTTTDQGNPDLPTYW